MSLVSDTHGGFNTIARVSDIVRNNPELKPEELGVIILGDCGLNFYLNNTDQKYKKILANYGVRIYCVRGNHEARPESLNYEIIYDSDVEGEVYLDPINSHIRYFKDGGIYNINGFSILTIGGAYSVDKWYRLARAGLTEETNNPKKSGWFADECLTKNEMENIAKNVTCKSFDFVFTHTCPISWEPRDLFLNFIDQNSVDKSMENWLEDTIKANIHWDIWCFGHYHADRIERPYVEQFYYHWDSLENIWERWHGENSASYNNGHFNSTSPFYHS